MAKFFSKDPEIEWQKVFCPICQMPTGAKSHCENLDVNEVPAYKRFMIKRGNVIPIFSKSCIYKRENLWLANLNYPASEPLLKLFKSINGIDSVSATKPHTFQISIAPLFDEREVKKKINLSYREFIKSLQAKERGTVEQPSFKGIAFPNGQEYVHSSDTMEESLRQAEIFSDIIENIAGSRGIALDPPPPAGYNRVNGKQIEPSGSKQR